MEEEKKPEFPPQKEEVKQAEQPEGVVVEKPEEAQQQDMTEEGFDAQKAIEALQAGYEELASQVSMIKEALDNAIGEENPEAPVAQEAKQEVKEPEEKEEKKEEKAEEAKHSKRLEELEGEVKILKAQLSKIGIKRTMQSESIRRDPISDEAREGLKRLGAI